MEENSREFEVERRGSERLKIDLSIIYQINKPWYMRVLIEGKEVEAQALDLGEGGIAISTDYDIPKTSVLAIKIMIYKVAGENNFKFYKTVLAQGTVCSNVLLKPKLYRIGISFLEIDEGEKKELLDFAKLQNNMGIAELEL